MLNEEQNPWQITGQRDVYDNPWIQLTEYDVINPGGGKGIYGKVSFKNTAIGVIPLDEDNNTWIVGQYRFPTDDYSWEIPEGGGGKHETPLEAAHRELHEETGLKALRWDKLLDMQLSNSVTDEIAIVYLARDLSQHEAQPEETESLVVKKIAFEKAFDMVMKGEIKDAISVAAVLKLHYLLEQKLI